jgi:Fic family protein
MVPVEDGGWPALTFEARHWTPHPMNRGPRADRMLGEYRSAVVPAIADARVRLAPATMALVEHGAQAAEELQGQALADLGALTGALLRSESVASSKIEQLSASQADVALISFGALSADRGPRAAEIARSVAANMAAMHRAVAHGNPTQPVTIQDLLDIHTELIKDDPRERREAGRLRGEQSWIGGSDFSPRGALFVPPAPARVRPALEDLVRFCGRDDVAPVALAAVAHAQFETIHPFADGNGRSGRALVHLLWRRTGLAPRCVVPVSTALLADVDSYFAGLRSYRAGELDTWVSQFAVAALRAAVAGQQLAKAVVLLREQWREDAGPLRRGSAAAALVDGLLRSPVVDLERAGAISPVNKTNLYAALDRLVDAGVLVEVTRYRRNRVWYAPGVFDLLERFEASLGRRSLPTVTSLLPQPRENRMAAGTSVRTVSMPAAGRVVKG